MDVKQIRHRDREGAFFLVKYGGQAVMNTLYVVFGISTPCSVQVLHQSRHTTNYMGRPKKKQVEKLKRMYIVLTK